MDRLNVKRNVDSRCLLILNDEKIVRSFTTLTLAFEEKHCSNDSYLSTLAYKTIDDIRTTQWHTA
jgi:hypothetical protein